MNTNNKDLRLRGKARPPSTLQAELEQLGIHAMYDPYSGLMTMSFSSVQRLLDALAAEKV